MKPIFQVLPSSIRAIVQALPRAILSSLEEIRIRQERPLEVITSDQSWFVSPTSQLSLTTENSLLPSREDCIKMLNLLSNHSLYTLEEELRRGYITIDGGHRVGLVGKVVLENGKVKYLRDITGFNIRVARQIKGIGERIAPHIMQKKNIHNLLIASPPQCGKTTLIRDLARLASTGSARYSSHKVGIVDERSEIAGCVGGVPQHDVGPRTDVLDGCSKAEGMMMLIRAMSPEVLVVDEIGSKADVEAIHEAVYAGVHLFVTVHGRSLEEVTCRPYLSELLNDKIFERILLLSRSSGPGSIEAMYDQDFRSINLEFLCDRENEIA